MGDGASSPEKNRSSPGLEGWPEAAVEGRAGRRGGRGSAAGRGRRRPAVRPVVAGGSGSDWGRR